jgi:malate dehydrogenase (oxaloacetate-decarboxylating)(NADP+)
MRIDTTLSLELRNKLGLRGIMPPGVDSPDIQIERCLERIRAKETNLDKYFVQLLPINEFRYEYLANLRYTNVHLFYKLLMAHIQVMLIEIYANGSS